MERIEGKPIPEEIIIKILKFVPKRHWTNIAQANKFFYDIICDLEKYDHPLLITEGILHDTTKFQLIENSRRKFKTLDIKVSMNCNNIWSLIDLMVIHGKSIKNASIEDINLTTNIQAWLLIGLLNQIPNVKTLKIKATNLTISCWGNETLNTSKLEEISLEIKGEAKLDRFLLAFQPHIIKKFSIVSRFEVEGIENFLLYQKSIKELEISALKIDPKIFKHLNLDVITFTFRRYRETKLMLELIRQQHDLKEIHLKVESARRYFYRHSDSDDEIESDDDSDNRGRDILDAMCELKDLEYIDFYGTDEKIEHMHKLSRIENLKKINFLCYEIMDGEEGAVDISLVRLKKLEIAKIKDDTIGELALNNISTNWINLKELTIHVPYLSLNTILKKLPNLESLKVLTNDHYEYDCFEEYGFEKFAYYYDGIQYPKMKKLFIEEKFKISNDLIESLPNLEHLTIDQEFSYTNYSLNTLKLLSNLKNLKTFHLSFKVKAPTTIITDEVAIIKNLYRNLDEFYLKFKCSSESRFNIELKDKLESTIMILDVKASNEQKPSILEIKKNNGKTRN